MFFYTWDQLRELYEWIVVKPKPNQLQQPIRNKENTLKNRWVFKVKTTRGKTRATKTWLVLVVHLIGWRDFSWTNQKQNEAKPKKFQITFVTHLKTALATLIRKTSLFRIGLEIIGTIILHVRRKFLCFLLLPLLPLQSPQPVKGATISVCKDAFVVGFLRELSLPCKYFGLLQSGELQHK